MRTLNRTLCLVLALVMCLGLFGVASATYPDSAKIQYNEAVEVMSGIGAINGMGDGTFNPTGAVTRAQAAKMVAYAVLGETVAKALPTTASSFKDVDANYAWATPSIEYLVKLGVINGRGNGTFDPEGKVTAYEIAKMLLCAAGYGKNNEFTGNGWELNVAIAAQKAGVFTGTKATDLNAGATREECALYCFNVLTTVNQVSYSKTDDVYTSTGKTLGTDVYGLAKDTSKDTDSFGRPATVWVAPKVSDDSIAAVTKAAVATYTDASYAKALTDGTYTFDANVKIVNNGNEMTGLTVAELASRKLNGTGIELYNTDTDKDIDLIVMTQAYLAKVTAFTATKGTTAGSYSVAIYNPWATPATGTKTVTDNLKSTTDQYDLLAAAGLAKDSYFMVYTVGADLSGDMLKVEAVKTVPGALSTYNVVVADGFNGKLTVGGTEYTLASACVEDSVDGFISTNLANYLTKNVTLVLDQNNMVVGVSAEKIEVASDLAYLTYTYTVDAQGTFGSYVTSYWAQAVNMEGKEVKYQLTEAEYNSLRTGTDTNVGLYNVTTATDATLKVTVADFTEAADVANTVKVDTASTAIKTSDVKVADGAYYDANTKFLFVTGSASTLKVVTATGVQATTGGDNYTYYATKAATDANYVVKYVVVEGSPVATTSSSLIFTGALSKANAVSYTKADGTNGVAYKNYVFIDGKPTQILTTDVKDTAGNAVAQGFYTFTKDAATGIYSLTKATTGFGQGAVANVYGNLVSITGQVVVNGTPANIAAATTGADINASGAYIADTVYYRDVLANGTTSLTNTTTLAGLVGTTPANIAFTFTTSASGAMTITGIYVVSQAAN